MALKILVVDDQNINRTILTRSLELHGHSVVTAANGQEAIEQYTLESPDIVLLDVIMPVMDGFEAAPRLKALSPTVYLPIIFLTALDDQNSLKECLEVGGDDFLSKPFDQVILAAKIEAHARTRELSIKTFQQKKKLDYYKYQTEREFQIIEHIYERALSDNYINEDIITTHLAPAETFNGDIVLTALSPSGNVYVFLGDFTGHGLAASIGTLPVSKAFYALTRKGLSVPDIANEINKILYGLLPTEMFCAAAIVEMNYSASHISIWAGGVPDLYLVNKLTGIREIIESKHMPLGILDNQEFDDEIEVFKIENTDRVFICSDGVIELENPHAELFGENRLRSILNDGNNSCVSSLIETLDVFKENARQNDDITIIELKCQKVKLPSQSDPNFSKIPHQYQFKFNADDIKTVNPIDEITESICSIKGVLRHKSNIFLILSEAYNNALEHGVLKMNSALKRQKDGFFKYYAERAEKLAALENHFIDIKINYRPNFHILNIEISDSGDGFEVNSNTTFSNENDDFGRGIKLLNEIATEVRYNKAGNAVSIDYLLLE